MATFIITMEYTAVDKHMVQAETLEEAIDIMRETIETSLFSGELIDTVVLESESVGEADEDDPLADYELDDSDFYDDEYDDLLYPYDLDDDEESNDD